MPQSQLDLIRSYYRVLRHDSAPARDESQRRSRRARRELRRSSALADGPMVGATTGRPDGPG
jgi:hypothetical protein